MRSIDRQYKPVEEATPVAGGATEQAVLFRRQPDQAQIIGEGAGGGGGAPVDAVEPFSAHLAAGHAGHRARAGRIAAAEAMLAARAVRDADGNGEAAGPALPGHIREGRSPQSAPLGEKRQSLQQIGLAGAVLARQRDKRRRDREIERPVGPEILKQDALDPHRRRHGIILVAGVTRRAAYTRIGISTYRAEAPSRSRISVGAPGSASLNRAVSPSSWPVMSSR